jgi:putative intracellular protease/amidase
MSPRTVSIVLFEGFELLDVFGPVELFSVLPNEFDVSFLGPTAGPVASSQDVTVNTDRSYDDASPADIMLIPGGIGTRTDAAQRAVDMIESEIQADPTDDRFADLHGL